MVDSEPEMAGLDRAIAIATKAHAGETDKAGSTYIRHPLRVMRAMDTETERIVAVLHDVVEDSEWTLSEIEAEFDTEIRDAVDCLTKDENKREQMDDTEYYLTEFIPQAAANDIARKVKRADIEDNIDITRLPEVSEDDFRRLRKYHAALQKL